MRTTTKRTARQPATLEFCFRGKTYVVRAATALARQRVARVITASAARHDRDLTAALEKEGRGDIMIVVGGVIPPSDYAALYKAGATAVFGPGTNIPAAAADLLDKLNAKMGYGPRVAAE